MRAGRQRSNRRPAGLRSVGACLILGWALAGCAEADPEPLRVLAASSLTDALDRLSESFAGGAVGTSYAGSQIARLQIEQGAPADVFASADERHIGALVRAGLVTGEIPFAHNELVVIVPREGSRVETFTDLPEARRIVLADPEVPAGRYAGRLLARADEALGGDFERRVRSRVVSEESNVRLVRAKVELGEADAAIVYRSDAVSSDRVRVIPVPEAFSVQATYYVGVVTGSHDRELAEAWIAHLRSAAGRAALEAHGFDAVEAP